MDSLREGHSMMSSKSKFLFHLSIEPSMVSSLCGYMWLSIIPWSACFFIRIQEVSEGWLWTFPEDLIKPFPECRWPQWLMLPFLNLDLWSGDQVMLTNSPVSLNHIYCSGIIFPYSM